MAQKSDGHSQRSDGHSQKSDGHSFQGLADALGRQLRDAAERLELLALLHDEELRRAVPPAALTLPHAHSGSVAPSGASSRRPSNASQLPLPSLAHETPDAALRQLKEAVNAAGEWARCSRHQVGHKRSDPCDSRDAALHLLQAATRHLLAGPAQAPDEMSPARRSLISNQRPTNLKDAWIEKTDTMALTEIEGPSGDVSRLGDKSSSMHVGRMAQASHIITDRNAFFQRLIGRPTTFWRAFVDLTAICLVVFSAIDVPMVVFSPEEGLLSRIMAFVLPLCWTFHMAITFLTGFYTDHGLLDLRLSSIARRYARTWLVADAVCLSVDWVTLLKEIFPQPKWVLDGMEVLRFVRLLRLGKIDRLLQQTHDNIQSARVLLLLGIVRPMVILLYMCHVIACSWYGMGTYYRKSEFTWLDVNDMISTTTAGVVQTRSLGYRYWTSLHWSLTQFTPASMEVVPTNTAERVFTVLVVVLGMVAFSSLVGSVSACVMQLRNLNAKSEQQEKTLRRYMQERNVSGRVRARVWRFVRDSTKARKEFLREEHVELLGKFPKRLIRDIRIEVFGSVLDSHILFKKIRTTNIKAYRRIATSAIQELFLGFGGELYTSGTPAQHMFFVVRGELELPVSTQKSRIIGPKGWLFEAALWVNTRYRWPAVAVTDCELLDLMAEEFCRALVDMPEALDYGDMFLRRVLLESKADTDNDFDASVLVEIAEEAFGCDEVSVRTNSQRGAVARSASEAPPGEGALGREREDARGAGWDRDTPAVQSV